MKRINIYTDGACSGNQNDNNTGGWGAILEYGQHIKELHGGEVNTTNNKMELTALIEALSALKEKGITSYKMRKDRIMGERTIQQIRDNQLVSWETMTKICELVQCQPGDILQYVSDGNS